jgi:hypothetical protein
MANITEDFNLPTEDELTVPEVNLSSPALRAGSFHMGKYCENQNNVRTTASFCYIITDLNKLEMFL